MCSIKISCVICHFCSLPCYDHSHKRANRCTTPTTHLLNSDPSATFLHSGFLPDQRKALLSSCNLRCIFFSIGLNDLVHGSVENRNPKRSFSPLFGWLFQGNEYINIYKRLFSCVSICSWIIKGRSSSMELKWAAPPFQAEWYNQLVVAETRGAP